MRGAHFGGSPVQQILISGDISFRGGKRLGICFLTRYENMRLSSTEPVVRSQVLAVSYLGSYILLLRLKVTWINRCKNLTPWGRRSLLYALLSAPWRTVPSITTSVASIASVESN